LHSLLVQFHQGFGLLSQQSNQLRVAALKSFCRLGQVPMAGGQCVQGLGQYGWKILVTQADDQPLATTAALPKFTRLLPRQSN
jgi:hypothetical protein